MVQEIAAVSFSPTGQTAKVVETLAEKMGQLLQVPVRKDHFTLPGEQKIMRVYGEDTLVVFGTPTYAGRVPNKALPFVQQLFGGKKTPALAVVTFGNRAYDSALTELRNELEHNGLTVIGAGAFATPHAFANIGKEHPSAADKALLDFFAERMAERLQEGKPLQTVKIRDDAPVAPYYIPKGMDGQPAKFLKAKPQTDLAKCTHCGTCARVCPMGSINPDNTDEVPGICIKCQACVTYCLAGAKYFDDPRFLSHKEYLETHFQRSAFSNVFI